MIENHSTMLIRKDARRSSSRHAWSPSSEILICFLALGRLIHKNTRAGEEKRRDSAAHLFESTLWNDFLSLEMSSYNHHSFFFRVFSSYHYLFSKFCIW